MAWKSAHDLSTIGTSVMHTESRWVELSTGVVIVIRSGHVIDIREARVLVGAIQAWSSTLSERAILMSVAEHLSECALVRVLRCRHIVAVVGVCRDG